MPVNRRIGTSTLVILHSRPYITTANSPLVGHRREGPVELVLYATVYCREALIVPHIEGQRQQSHLRNVVVVMSRRHPLYIERKKCAIRFAHPSS